MTTLIELSKDIEELVARTAPSVVAVEHHGSQGSGIVVADDGYVVTNAHVAHCDRGELGVSLPGADRLRAELVGEDPATDIALLRVDARGLPSLALAEDRRMRVGQLVVAIGNPLRFERSVTLGVVSALERSLPGGGRPPRMLEGLVQTDAAINPGSSGGPLLDPTGAVVGITTAIIPYARGIGFAIPAHTASWIASILMRHGRIDRPMLGIQARGEDLGAALATDTGQPRALRVFAVSASSPAADAGLKSGDLLLTANGRPLYGVDDLQRVMVLTSGAELALDVFRDRQRRALSAKPSLYAA